MDTPKITFRGLATTGSIRRRIDNGSYSEFFRTNGLLYFWGQLTYHLTLLRGALPPGSPLKIVIAGCAEGEEAYSVAMLVKKLGLDKCFAVEIIGFDREKSRVTRAREGFYLKTNYDSLAVRPEYQGYFLGLNQKDQSAFGLRPEIKRMVKFEEADLFSPAAPNNADIVIAHNLRTSLPKEQERLIPACAALAKRGGLLFINYLNFSPLSNQSMELMGNIIFDSETDKVIQIM